MLTNLEKDKSLDVSKEQKTAMVIAAENLLNSGYDSRYVAGVLANILRGNQVIRQQEMQEN